MDELLLLAALAGILVAYVVVPRVRARRFRKALEKSGPLGKALGRIIIPGKTGPAFVEPDRPKLKT